MMIFGKNYVEYFFILINASGVQTWDVVHQEEIAGVSHMLMTTLISQMRVKSSSHIFKKSHETLFYLAKKMQGKSKSLKFQSDVGPTMWFTHLSIL